MTILLTTLAAALVVALVLLRPQPASAHCDTLDGPTATDGQTALETGNINYALKWIDPEGEDELRRVFEKSLKVRTLGDEARELADQYFLETLVRIHRAGEGAGFEGLKPHGVPIDERVAAADRSIEVGSVDPLVPLVPAEQLPELERRLARVLAAKDYDVDDLAAGRAYIEAYVHFFKYAEGHDHDEHGHGEHGHDPHAHAHGESGHGAHEPGPHGRGHVGHGHVEHRREH